MNSLSYHSAACSSGAPSSSMLGMSGMNGATPASSAVSGTSYPGMTGYSNAGFTLGEGLESEGPGPAQLGANSHYRPQNEDVRLVNALRLMAFSDGHTDFRAIINHT